jgi:uncharacterized protein (TIGR00303 family)
MCQDLIKVYTQFNLAEQWLNKYQQKIPIFTCILGFTDTGLIPHISAAGATPEHRKYTAIADAEFLFYGDQKSSKFPLPPLNAGVSPVYISRAVISAFNLPLYIFNAGLLQGLNIPHIDLEGKPAHCVTTGAALPLDTVKKLFAQGLKWGEKLAKEIPDSYIIISECVVGGTTTALAILTALGIHAEGKINSSYPICNHEQKWQIVHRGLEKFNQKIHLNKGKIDPLKIIAAVGDPMQIVAAGMAIAASNYSGVLLAGGTQMLAVYALIQAIINYYQLSWQPERIAIGTTRWVAEDQTGDTIGLAESINLNQNLPILLATKLSFAHSSYPQLRIYEQGFVKEGVGAGGAAISSHLLGWNHHQLLTAIESLISNQHL